MDFKKILFVAMLSVMAVLLLVFSLACSQAPTPTVPGPTLVPAKMEPEAATITADPTNRGFGYIPLNFDGEVTDHVSEVLAVLQKFETEHQGTFITGWTVEVQHRSYSYGERTYGIWISYRKVPK